MHRAFFWTFALSALLACASSSAADRGRLAAGVWGGPHIRLDVSGDGTAAVELDCAHGTITEPVVPDAHGAFRAKGTYAAEHHGPIRESEEDTSAPAVYSGTVQGGEMTLTITVAGSKEELGPFALTQGKTPRLTKCL